MIIFMSPIPFLSKSRGTRNLVSRIRTVLNNFSISPKKFEHLLRRYSTVTLNLGCVPTFPITAVILKRHPRLIRELYQQGAEFAIHGYIHTDYGVMPLNEQVKHFKKAIDTFEKHQVPFTGFRAPFVRVNTQTPQALSKLGFPYDSSLVLHWDVFNRNEHTEGSWIEYERILDFYQSRQAQDYISIPRSMDGFIEIPGSMPDDEIIVERMGITDKRKIGEIWQGILQSTYNNNELFALSLHPERFSYCEDALVSVIKKAKELNPPVWIASLKEITEWWQEKKKFAFKIDSRGNGKYGVQTELSDRATVLLKNSKVNVPTGDWFDGYRTVNSRDFVLESPKRPVMGVSRDSSPAAVAFLKNEGYIVEASEQPDDYGIYLNNLAKFNEASEKPLLKKIEQSDAPILRYWRWPNRAKSTLTVTGDIDSITLVDFVLRIMENWRLNRR